MTANINFLNLRASQRKIAEKATWVGVELEGLPYGTSDEHKHIVEAWRQP